MLAVVWVTLDRLECEYVLSDADEMLELVRGEDPGGMGGARAAIFNRGRRRRDVSRRIRLLQQIS
jgi:hypothetical protein